MGLGGISHWIIILLIVLVVFGAGRISSLMGEMGKGIKSFKEGLNEGEQPQRPVPPAQIPPQPSYPPVAQQPIDITPQPRPDEPVAPPPPASDDRTN